MHKFDSIQWYEAKKEGEEGEEGNCVLCEWSGHNIVERYLFIVSISLHTPIFKAFLHQRYARSYSTLQTQTFSANGGGEDVRGVILPLKTKTYYYNIRISNTH